MLDESQVIKDLARIEAAVLSGFDAVNHRLDRLNGKTDRHDADISGLKSGQERMSEQLLSRDRMQTRISDRDKTFLMIFGIVVALIAPASGVGIAIWGT